MSSIHELGNPTKQLWHSGQNNQSISLMRYGAADAMVRPGPGAFGNQVLGAGCANTAFGCDGKSHLDLYLDRLSGGIKASQRQGFDRLGGITDGELPLGLSALFASRRRKS